MRECEEASKGRAAEDARKPGLDGFAVASSARKTPAMAMNTPTKTRKLKNADCELDFFFIWRIQVDQV